jgi:hypothetical protein
MRLSTKSIALAAIFAALYYGLSVLPGIPVVGLGNLKIELEASFASVLGIILGPFLGSLTAFVGTSMAWALPPSSGDPYGLPFIMAPVINALIVGLVYVKRWREAFIVFAVVIAGFWLMPLSQPLNQYYYVAVAATFDKIIALFLIIPTVKIKDKLTSLQTLPLLFFLLTFIGNQADSALGSLIFATPVVYTGPVYGPYVESLATAANMSVIDFMRFLYVVSPLFYPAIRIIQSVIATMVAVPLFRALSMAGFSIPIKPLEVVKIAPKRESESAQTG